MTTTRERVALSEKEIYLNTQR